MICCGTRGWTRRGGVGNGKIRGTIFVSLPTLQVFNGGGFAHCTRGRKDGLISRRHGWGGGHNTSYCISVYTMNNRGFVCYFRCLRSFSLRVRWGLLSRTKVCAL